ncbi:MAG: DUF2510 domain-containing protein [Pseudolysinimonas sp.]
MTEPAAGWYHDPAGAGAWRWWDGATWTDHVRPMTDTPLETAPVAQIPTNVTPITAPPSNAYQPVPTHAPVFDDIAPAQVAPAVIDVTPAPEAAPASGPVTVAPTTIPQPGQVAPAPPVAGGAVPMTPETPVSDQLYWHSAAAEVIEVPRHHNPTTSSHGGPGLNRAAPAYVRDWNDLGSPNTVGIWLLAFSPLIVTAVSIALPVGMSTAGVTGQVPRIVAGVASLLLMWAFAALDARALGERGYHPPRVAWMLLLPPLFYFIARGKAVRRESKHAWPPELVFVLNLLALAGIVVLAAAALMAMFLYAPVS